MPDNPLQKLALKITTGSKTGKEKIEKLYHYVREKIKYKITIIGDPEKILELGYGSCLDNALLFSGLLKSINIRTRYHLVLVDFKFLSRIFFLAKLTPSVLRIFSDFHIFNEVYSQGEGEKWDTAFDSEIEKYF
jgi:transglutaminase-like putative cysteine protease